MSESFGGAETDAPNSGVSRTGGSLAGGSSSGGSSAVSTPRPLPLWLSGGALAAGAGFAALAAEAGGGFDGVALLTGAAGAGGLGLFGLVERVALRAARKAQDPRESFRRLLGRAPVMAALVDRSGRIQEINRAAASEAAARGVRPLGAADLLFGAEDPQRAVFELLGAAFGESAPAAPIERRLSGGLTASASPAGDGLALLQTRWSGAGEGRDAPAERSMARASVDRLASGLGTEASELAEAAGGLEAAAAACGVAWFKVGPTGRVSAASPLFEEWTGARAGRRPSLQTLFPDLSRDPDCRRRLQLGAAAGPAVVATSRLIGAPGAPRRATVALGGPAGGDLFGIVAPLPEARDAAERPEPTPRKGEEGREARLLAAFDALPAERMVFEAGIGVMLLTSAGRILRLNAAADRLLIDRAAERGGATGIAGPLGDHLIDWIAEEDREPAEERLASAAAGGAAAFEARLLAPDGGEGRLAQCFLSGVDSPAGRLILLHMIDASEQRGLDHSFIQSQKLQAVGQLVGGIAHDFNNLLTVIIGSSDALLRKAREEDPAYADLSAIRQSGRRAAWLVGQLLAYSRKQTLTPRIADLTERCSDFKILLDRVLGERYRLDADFQEALWPVEVDVNQFEQVITNLVVNASHAMPQGGAIRIETRNETVLEPRAQGNFSMPPGDYVRVTVEDHGCGIPQAALAKIYEPFFTTKPEGKGTGLGLAVVYGVVKQSHGFVFVDTEIDQGTTFSIYLPRASEERLREAERLRAAAGGKRAGLAPEAPRAGAAALKAAAARLGGAAARSGGGAGAEAEEPAPKAAPARPGVVLLVEDQAPVRAIAARSLAERGHKVIEAESGEEALAVLRDESVAIDLMLSDVVLEDTDGPSVLREVGSARPEMRVIFMSGYARDAFAETLDSASGPSRAAQFLQKPFTLDELGEAVAEALAREPG